MIAIIDKTIETNNICWKNNIKEIQDAKMAIKNGIRLGTQAATTRGFGVNEFRKVGELITKVIVGLSKTTTDNSKIEKQAKEEVIKLCSLFPIYNHLKGN